MESIDLVLPCTGRRPNSKIIADWLPACVSPDTGRILVSPHLQLQHETYTEMLLTNIFALGDVAETKGPKMARAGMMQAEVVVLNILSLIKGRKPAQEYVPDSMEGELKLSLGLKEAVIYAQDKVFGEILLPEELKSVDLEVDHVRKSFGVDESAE